MEQFGNMSINQHPNYVGQLGNISNGWPSGWQQSNIDAQRHHFLQAMQANKEQSTVPTGTKPVVICGSKTIEAKDLDDAQAIAEREAHAQGTDAYVLKPVRKVAPKRDVVTTDL